MRMASSQDFRSPGLDSHVAPEETNQRNLPFTFAKTPNPVARRLMSRPYARSLHEAKSEEERHRRIKLKPLSIKRSTGKRVKLSGWLAATKPDSSDTPDEMKILLRQTDDLLCKCITGSCANIEDIITEDRRNSYLQHIHEQLPNQFLECIDKYNTVLFGFCGDFLIDSLEAANNYDLNRDFVSAKMRMFRIFSTRRISDILSSYPTDELSHRFVFSALEILSRNVLYITVECMHLLHSRPGTEGKFVFQCTLNRMCSYIDEFRKHNNKIRDTDFNPKTVDYVRKKLRKLQIKLDSCLREEGCVPTTTVDSDDDWSF